jgi:hypothetical protein
MSTAQPDPTACPAEHPKYPGLTCNCAAGHHGNHYALGEFWQADNPGPGRDWSAMRPADFDTDAPPTQLGLFAEPDPTGTPDMFTAAAEPDALSGLVGELAGELADELPYLWQSREVSGPQLVADFLRWELERAPAPFATCSVCRTLLVRDDGSTGCRCDGSIS